MYAVVVSIYLAYPLIGYAVLGGRYEPTNDDRLYALQPDPYTVLSISGYSLTHLVCFLAAYLTLRGRAPVLSPGTIRGSNIGTSLVLVYGALTAFLLAMATVYDLRSADYWDSYLVSRRLPLLVAQALVHLSGLRFTLQLGLLLWLFLHYRKYRVLLWTWMVTEALLTVVKMGSRTELVLLCVAAAMLYHACVRRVRIPFVVVCGLAGFMAFSVFGAVRGGTPLDEAWNPFIHGSECDAAFGTAVDLENRVATGQVGPLPVEFHLQDLIALVPQQLMPVQKMDAATWYVDTFYRYYADQGGGLAFGTVAQAVIGGGLADVALRGLVLGALFAGAHSFCARRSRRWWAPLAYLWLVVSCYQCYRNTTFSLLVLAEYRVLPAILLVGVVAKVIGSVGSPHTRVRAAGVHSVG